jgi:uncharacterized protein YjbI with pentapeptide repeats
MSDVIRIQNVSLKTIPLFFILCGQFFLENIKNLNRITYHLKLSIIYLGVRPCFLVNNVMKKTSLISLLPQILLSHKEWFDSKGEKGIFADLSEEDLREGNFRGCVLVEANLQAADLSGADFTNADLRGANLLEAQLKNTQLQNANFDETDLMWANLQGANLENTRLDGAYLQGANLKDTCVTSSQIKCAYIDEDTQLPENIARPS